MGCFLSSPPVTSSQLFLMSSVVSSSPSLQLSFALMGAFGVPVCSQILFSGRFLCEIGSRDGRIHPSVCAAVAPNHTKTQIKERISNFYLLVQMKKLGKTTFGVDTQIPSGAKVSRVCGDDVR